MNHVMESGSSTRQALLILDKLTSEDIEQCLRELENCTAILKAALKNALKREELQEELEHA